MFCDPLQATSAKATRKQEKVLLPNNLFVPDDQVCGCVWWRVIYWCTHLPTCLCVRLTDCGPPVYPFCLQNLFNVTDVFLDPPDYVANLQKVTEPTLILTASPTLYSCYLLPSPASNSQCNTPQCPIPLDPRSDSPPPDLPACPPGEPPTALRGAGQESEKETQVCQSGVGPTPAQFTGRVTSQQASKVMP